MRIKVIASDKIVLIIVCLAVASDYAIANTGASYNNNAFFLSSFNGRVFGLANTAVACAGVNNLVYGYKVSFLYALISVRANRIIVANTEQE
ncbi:hypothetical protein SPACI_008330 [Sporomusa acidovorans DSM 3132]|uniref:Uncharacterized protein n=1 Tax=Sporomusa acidovorans (strain ATCC 49682 / DSM 3132 / Mol) TaxID=1123286 RepID=A0ABZ3IY56_SPOA4|nr:hypothetical protein SPACI_15810 [Sporomusa acidovorans DSM 3132]SDE81165.1 hypothetical protein SAMN04488499_102212 [Sporomusa acidovorans]